MARFRFSIFSGLLIAAGMSGFGVQTTAGLFSAAYAQEAPSEDDCAEDCPDEADAAGEFQDGGAMDAGEGSEPVGNESVDESESGEPDPEESESGEDPAPDESVPGDEGTGQSDGDGGDESQPNEQGSGPTEGSALAVALKAALQGDGVRVELEKIAPFDESNVSREYREQRFETLLNLIRTEGAVCADPGGTHAPNPTKVRSNPLLNEAAYQHARYLVEERKAIEAAGSPNPHTQTLTGSPLFTGADMGERATKAGYTGSINGENFAGGNGNDVAVQSIMLWFNSTSGHCSGMFNRSFSEFGFGAVNYVNVEFHGNNEFKSIFMTGE